MDVSSNAKVALIALVLVAFAALTGYAVVEVGYLGIFAAATHNAGAVQVFVDLAIVCALACIWMFFDTRTRQLNPWPFIVVTLLAGCFGPLLYLLRREWLAKDSSGSANRPPSPP